jgi:hypothetical protein
MNRQTRVVLECSVLGGGPRSTKEGSKDGGDLCRPDIQPDVCTNRVVLEQSTLNKKALSLKRKPAGSCRRRSVEQYQLPPPFGLRAAQWKHLHLVCFEWMIY